MVDISDIPGILRRNMLWLLIGPLLTISLALGFLAFKTPSYRAVVEILIEPQGGVQVLANGPGSGLAGADFQSQRPFCLGVPLLGLDAFSFLQEGFALGARPVAGNQVAEVLTPPDGEGIIQVRFGILKTTASLLEIEGLNGEKAELRPKQPKAEAKKRAEKPQPEAEAPLIRTSQNTLDIRGQRVADAEIEMDRTIAEAQGPIWIIHGHGTGRLKRGVHEFLKQHRRVERFEPAGKAEGGNGVTVVYPK